MKLHVSVWVQKKSYTHNMNPCILTYDRDFYSALQTFYKRKSVWKKLTSTNKIY